MTVVVLVAVLGVLALGFLAFAVACVSAQRGRSLRAETGKEATREL